MNSRAGAWLVFFLATAFPALVAAPSVPAAPSARLAAALQAAAFRSKKEVVGAKDVAPVANKIDRELAVLKAASEQARVAIEHLARRRTELQAQRAELAARLSLVSFDNQQKTNQCFELLAQLNLHRELLQGAAHQGERAGRSALARLAGSGSSFDRRLARYNLVTTTTVCARRPLLILGNQLVGEDLRG